MRREGESVCEVYGGEGRERAEEGGREGEKIAVARMRIGCKQAA